MKNKEKYFDEIMDIATYSRLAVSNETNKPCRCNRMNCSDCLLSGSASKNKSTCDKEAQKWLEAEYVEPSIDWSKVEVDTKVLVSENGKNWFKRYFAKYKNGKVYAWLNGGTSWSTTEKMSWKYAKLYEGENENEECD